MKRTKLITLLLVAIFLIVSPSVYAEKEMTKIGFVDLSRLFDDYHKTKNYDKELEIKHGSFEKLRDSKIEKIRENQGKLALLKEDKKADLEGEIEQMKADLLEYDRQQKTDLTKERNEKIREILLEIEKVVSEYAEKENYSLILNDRVLIYGTESIDITEVILGILNG